MIPALHLTLVEANGDAGREELRARVERAAAFGGPALTPHEVHALLEALTEQEGLVEEARKAQADVEEEQSAVELHVDRLKDALLALGIDCDDSHESSWNGREEAHEWANKRAAEYKADLLGDVEHLLVERLAGWPSALEVVRKTIGELADYEASPKSKPKRRR